MRKLYVLLGITLCSLLACKSTSDHKFSINEKPISLFLEVSKVKQSPHLKIKYDALNKDFMLYGAYIPMLGSTTGHTLKGRIVNFELFSDRVVMTESPEGLSIADKESSIILLAEFPIVQTKSDGVLVDFAKGMTTAFTSRNIDSRAISKNNNYNNEHFAAVMFLSSFVKEIAEEDNIIIIRQIAQWNNNKSQLLSAEFRYFLREYNPSTTFEAKTFGNNRWIQYFSTPPMIKPPTTSSVAYITKWDLNKPITFYISSNTPKIYRQAIKDGLYFWNHILKKKVIDVKIADKELSAPHSKLNVVQWVVWDNEASAYADMVADHRTGEIIQAQIYLRSGWVIQSAQKLKDNLTVLLISKPEQTQSHDLGKTYALPSPLKRSHNCRKSMSNHKEIFELAYKLGEDNTNNDIFTTLTSDIIRTVVAHEMGHVLGLRHNLASSSKGNISLSQRERILKKYLQTGDNLLDNTNYLSQSIMDVFSAADDALIGAQIRHLINEPINNSALAEIYDYDSQAIAYGYFDKPMKKNQPFCTDEQVTLFTDCKRWDIGDDLLYSAQMLNDLPKQVAKALADTFIDAISPNRNGGPIAISDVNLFTKNAMVLLKKYTSELFTRFSSKARSVSIEARFSALGEHNKEFINKERFKKIKETLETNGLENTLFALLPPFAKVHDTSKLNNIFDNQFKEKLHELKQKQPQLNFSSLQLNLAIKTAKDFFIALNNNIISEIVLLLSQAQFDDPNYQIPIEEAVGNIAKTIIFAHTGAQNYNRNILPQFTYDFKTRNAAAMLLNPSMGIIADWSSKNIQQVSNGIKNIIRYYGNASDSGIDLNKLTRARKGWLIEQSILLNTLEQASQLKRPIFKKVDNKN